MWFVKTNSEGPKQGEGLDPASDVRWRCHRDCFQVSSRSAVYPPVWSERIQCLGGAGPDSIDTSLDLEHWAPLLQNFDGGLCLEEPISSPMKVASAPGRSWKRSYRTSHEPENWLVDYQQFAKSVS